MLWKWKIPGILFCAECGVYSALHIVHVTHDNLYIVHVTDDIIINMYNVLLTYQPLSAERAQMAVTVKTVLCAARAATEVADMSANNV